MAKLIVKDRRLCIVNGRLVSDGDGAPCVCGGGGPPDCANGIPTLCVRVDFSGISPMPGFSPALPFDNLIDGTVETVAGVNRTFQYVDEGFGFATGTGLIVLVGEYQTPPTIRRFTLTDIRVEVGLSCCGDVIRIISVSMTAGLGGAVVFRWDAPIADDPCEWPVSGTAVANQTTPAGGSSGVYGVGQGGTATVTLTRACVPIPDTYALADPCEGGASISVDLAGNVNGLPGVEYQGARYRLTSEQTVAPPLPVTFIPEVCPVDPPTADFAIAERCDPFDPLGPDTVVYAVDPAIGLGQGAVRLIIQYPNPACPERACTSILQYRPTATPADGPATPGTAHLNGTACGLPTQTSCQSCPADPNPGDPIFRPRSAGDAMLEAMGFDPDEELRRVRSGGCCGQPGA